MGWLALGVALLGLAWLLPVNVKSLNPALLKEAGRDSTTTVAFGRALLEMDKPGPATLVAEAARMIEDPAAPALAQQLAEFGRRHPEMIPWGGWDAVFEPLLQPKTGVGATESQPVLKFLATRQARETLRLYLSVSRLPGVQTLLKTAGLTTTKRFVPAHLAGGQPLDAVILLTACLWQEGHFPSSLQREVRGLAEDAITTGQMGGIEEFYLDILSLGKRLDWVQLSELLHTATSTGTVAQFAHLARIVPEQLPVIYTATLMSGSADAVARYLIAFGKTGADNLHQALTFGQGAVEQLVQRQAPMTPGTGAVFEIGAAFALSNPELALLAKYGAFLAGIFLLLRSIDLRLFAPLARSARELAGTLPRMKSGLLALILTFIFFVFSEPYLLKAAPVSEYQLRLVIPVLGATSALSSATSDASATMNMSTVLSITVFALVQILMYVICLLKISEIDRRTLPSSLKLRLMDNEENLFDGGLYIGIAGTATALVLQVLGVIEANLLAAYSSNLFGIVCVALVKIRHVRPYKHKLIMDSAQLA
ncbi:MAG: hypothetical protein PHQ04_10210 [Opitutaceae bacterium]|nr:hypothetical protein [Opitutaceae bacterium]